MKNIKEYLNEGLIKRQAGANIKDKIRAWLDKYCKIRYKEGIVINDDLTIDNTKGGYIIIGDEWKEKELPDYIQFDEVFGDFYVGCKQLESLRGCPRKVAREFSCSLCDNLKNLEGAPEWVGLTFNCCYCKSLENFVGGPKYIGKRLVACRCTGLKSFEGIPKKLVELDISQNPYINVFPHPITQKQLKKLYDCDVDKIKK